MAPPTLCLAAPVVLATLVATLVSAQTDGGLSGDDAATPSSPALQTTPVANSAETPKLIQRADGTYAYHGLGFDAVIETDGSVRMRDVFARARFGLFPRPMANGEWRVNFFETKFDLFGWLERKFKKSDPYRSERRAFFGGTLELREQLAITSTRAHMEGALEALWSRPGIDFAERKRRTFALWDESSDDEVGQLGRAQVLAYIRKHCPADGPRGFSPELLQSLNATRRSRLLFAPYVE